MQVAQEFGKRHKIVLRDVRELDCSDDFRKLNFVPTFQKVDMPNGGTRKEPIVLMTRNGFFFLVMGYTGQKAAIVKEAIIKRFDEMETFIKTYILAKDDFPAFTQAIMDAHDEPKSYHYSTECDMINRIVLGCSAKQFRQAHDIPDGMSIRPYLTDTQAKTVRKLQTEDIRLLYTGVEYDDRKSRLITFYTQKYNIPVLPF